MQQQEMFPVLATAAQLSPKAAATRRDRGMRRGQSHADAERGDWKRGAQLGLEHFLRTHRGMEFLAEEFVAWSKERLYPQPPDGRAWGAIFSRARKLGMIEAVGTRKAATSNLSPKPLWRSLHI